MPERGWRREGLIRPVETGRAELKSLRGCARPAPRVIQLSQAGVAIPEVRCDFSVSEMLPLLGVAEMPPAMFRIEHRTLTADQTHGTVGLHVFHCHLPGLHIRKLIASLHVRVITIIRQN